MNKLMWGTDPQYFIKCQWCGNPAVAIFVNRTDGRNGPVCETHFNESNLTIMAPDPNRDRINGWMENFKTIPVER